MSDQQYDAGKYDYPYEYQLDVIKLAVQDAYFMSRYRGVFNQNYFVENRLRHVARIVANFFAKHNVRPSVSQLLDATEIYLATETSMPPALQDEIKEVVNRVSTEKVINPQVIAQSVRDFAHKQAIRYGAVNLVDSINRGEDAGKALRLFTKQVHVGQEFNEGVELFADVYDFKKRLLLNANYNDALKLKTGFRMLDDLTGGMGKAEVWVFVGSPKAGKSSAICSIGANAVRLSGANVLHYTLGDLDEDDVEVKYHQILNTATKQDLLASNVFIDKANSLKDKKRGAAVQVVYLSPGMFTVEDIEQDVHFRVAKYGKPPDLIIIDYVQKLKYHDYDNSNTSLRLIYEGLKRIGRDFGCAILTASQFNREAETKGTGRGYIADGFSQVAECDVMISIDRSDADKQSNRAKFILHTSRRSSGGEIPVFCDLGMSLFKDLSATEAAQIPVKGADGKPIMSSNTPPPKQQTPPPPPQQQQQAPPPATTTPPTDAQDPNKTTPQDPKDKPNGSV